MSSSTPKEIVWEGKTAVECPSKPPTASGSKLCLSKLVESVQQELLKGEGVDFGRIQKLMESYDSDLGEWKQYAFYDQGKPYTRNLICTDNETFTLILLCWNPGRTSPVHDHPNSQCFLYVVEGNMRENIYEHPKKEEEPLRLSRTVDVKTGQVAYINDGMGLHSLGNSCPDTPAVTLHMYIPPYKECMCYVDPTNSRGLLSKVTFYSEQGKLVEREI